MQNKLRLSDIKVCVKGGGDLASGVAWRLYQCGFKVLITEIDKPTAVRRKVAFCEAVYDGRAVVEGVETCSSTRRKMFTPFGIEGRYRSWWIHNVKQRMLLSLT